MERGKEREREREGEGETALGNDFFVGAIPAVYKQHMHVTTMLQVLVCGPAANNAKSMAH